jgi:hypothetical protein
MVLSIHEMAQRACPFNRAEKIKKSALCGVSGGEET